MRRKGVAELVASAGPFPTPDVVDGREDKNPSKYRTHVGVGTAGGTRFAEPAVAPARRSRAPARGVCNGKRRGGEG